MAPVVIREEIGFNAKPRKALDLEVAVSGPAVSFPRTVVASIRSEMVWPATLWQIFQPVTCGDELNGDTVCRGWVLTSNTFAN